MNAWPHLIAVAVCAIGATYLYLGAPRQQWLSRPWPAGISRGGGLALLALGWLVWCAVLHPVTAFFAVLTMLMATLTLAPAAVALLRRRRAGDEA